MVRDGGQWCTIATAINADEEHRRGNEATWRGVAGDGCRGPLAHVDALDLAATALDSIDELVLLLDADHRVWRANRAVTTRLGLRADEVLGRHCYEFVHGLSRPIADCPHEAALRDGGSHQVVIDEPSLDAVFAVRCRPLFNEHDDVLGTVQVMRELTVRGRPAGEVQQLRHRLAETVRALGQAAELRDPYTAHHQRRVAELASAVATELGLHERDREGLTFACQVHDIAKIGVPADILAKPGPLSLTETALVRMHVEGGAQLLAEIPFDQPVREIVLQHHERLDGSGYPRALRGDDLLLEARILAVADVVEAMASDRPYRRPLGMDAALAEVQEGAGTRYDPDVVGACRQVIAKGFRFSQ